MSISDILYIVFIGVYFLFTSISTIIGFIKSHKAKKKATTLEQKEAAKEDMEEQAKKLISSAEEFYKSLDVVLKSNGESAGPYKKESVMSKLQSYANEKGYNFDVEYWSDKIDKIVKLTKEVNAK